VRRKGGGGGGCGVVFCVLRGGGLTDVGSEYLALDLEAAGCPEGGGGVCTCKVRDFVSTHPTVWN